MMIRLLVALVGVLGLFVNSATAQEKYPSRPISLIAPFPPGGMADLVGRPLASALEKVLATPVVVVNKPGAGGAVGMSVVASSKPDGYTLLIAVVSISTIPEVDALFARTPAFTRDQFIGIARLSADAPAFLVRSDAPWKTLKEFVDDARKRPGEIVYSSSGIYAASHIPMEWLLQTAGIQLRHLPMTGGATALTSVLGGHAATTAFSIGLATPHLKGGKLRALALWGGARSPDWPDVPTLKELGYDIEYYIWAGLFAPKGSPPPIVKTLEDATRRAVRDPEFNAALNNLRTPVAYLDGDEFREWWKRDSQSLAAVIRRIGKVETK